MPIYTKTGDKGTTSLASGTRVSKTDERLEAYGTADELNSFIGSLRVLAPTETDDLLYYIQNRLFDIGATLAGAPIPLADDAATLLEKAIDHMQAELQPLRAFILPAGSESVSRCHICRTIARRLERNMLRIPNAPEQFSSELIFVNRLSDYFFVLSRHIAQKEGIEPAIWKK